VPAVAGSPCSGLPVPPAPPSGHVVRPARPRTSRIPSEKYASSPESAVCADGRTMLPHESDGAGVHQSPSSPAQGIDMLAIEMGGNGAASAAPNPAAPAGRLIGILQRTQEEEAQAVFAALRVVTHVGLTALGAVLSRQRSAGERPRGRAARASRQAAASDEVALGSTIGQAAGQWVLAPELSAGVQSDDEPCRWLHLWSAPVVATSRGLDVLAEAEDGSLTWGDYDVRVVGGVLVCEGLRETLTYRPAQEAGSQLVSWLGTPGALRAPADCDEVH